MLIILIGLPSVAKSQLPDKWLGIWEGQLKMRNANGDTIMPMGIRIEKTKHPGRWLWELNYGAGKDIRSYHLLTDSVEKNLFYTDEHNGIILEERLFNNTMMSVFQIDSTLLTISFELAEPGMRFRVTSLSLKGQHRNKTGQGTKEIPFIYNLQRVSFQEADLRKKK